MDRVLNNGHDRFDEQYDVVVIGGGPGGSTVATLVAEKGHRVLVIERAKFPRFHIGESLMP
jgi:halogenation protein CepH